MDSTLTDEITKLQMKLTRRVGKVLSVETGWIPELRSYGALRTGILEYSLIDVSARTLELRISGVVLDSINLESSISGVKISAPGESWSTDVLYENKVAELD